MSIFSTQQLAGRGIGRDRITDLVRDGRLTRLRRGRYATADADPLLAAAVALGGRLSCVSALARAGAWTMPHEELHVRVSAGIAVPGGTTHRFHRTRERLGDALLVDDLATAFALALRCLDLRAAVVVTDSVLNRRILLSRDVERILLSTPRGREVLRRSDGAAESGIETLARLGLRSRNLRVRTQVRHPPGRSGRPADRRPPDPGDGWPRVARRLRAGSRTRPRTLGARLSRPPRELPPGHVRVAEHRGPGRSPGRPTRPSLATNSASGASAPTQYRDWALSGRVRSRRRQRERGRRRRGAPRRGPPAG